MLQNYTLEFKKKIVRPKKLGYRREELHKIFENKLRQGFHADRANQK